MAKPLIGITTQRRDSQGGKRGMYGLARCYVEAVRRQGGLPVLIPLGLADGELRELYERLDGVVLSGGGDVEPRFYGSSTTDQVGEVDEERDQIEMLLSRWSVQEEKPILAICRGIQVLNVALGGTLLRDIASEVPGALKHNYYPNYPRGKIAHKAKVEEESRLAHALGAPLVDVNSLHHQAVKDLAPELRMVAQAPDGIVEGVEIDGHPYAIGVQWHPEWMQGAPEMQSLFATFIAASQNGEHAA